VRGFTRLLFSSAVCYSKEFSERLKALSDSRNDSTHTRHLADEDKVDMNLKLYLEKSNAITFAAMKSIVENIVQSSIVELRSEVQRSVSSDITGIEMIVVSDSTSTVPSTKPTSLPTKKPSVWPTHAPSVSKRPSTTPSEAPSAGNSVTTQTLAAVGGAAAAASSVSLRYVYTYIYKYIFSY